MVREYVKIANDKRRELLRLIYEENYTIANAARMTGIDYNNAKNINRTYTLENRI